ncbi:MAG: hypothetical protein ACE37K_10225 [Planctomycetota bacterium]
MSSGYLSKWSVDRPAAMFDGSPVLSLHLPKTAGSAFGEFLIRSLGRMFPIEHGRIDETFEQFLEAPGEHRFGNGHIDWSHIQRALDHPRPVHLITLLREPVARAVSNYTYCCSDKHPTSGEFRNAFPTIDRYIEWGGMSTNLQTRLIAGPDVESAEQAIERIESTYAFVGLTELFNASCFVFSLAFGCEFRLPERMVNAAKDRAEEDHDIPQSAYDRIREQNDLDLPVWEHFRRRYEDRMDDLVTLGMRSASWPALR